MKSILLSFLFCSQLGFTQIKPLSSNPEEQQRVNQCGIIIPPQSYLSQPALTSSFLSVNEAGNYINNILEAVNWKANFTLLEENGTNNAYATIINNKRYIIYDNKFLTALDKYARTNWASVSVLAHEMGHHYLNHLFTGAGSTPPKELEADYFSGYAMARLNVSLNDATAAMERVSPVDGDASHPGRAARVDAIRRGWQYAQGNTSPPTAGRTSVPQPQQNPPPPAADAGWINLALYGNNPMTVYLSDDGKRYSPVALKPTQPFVFKYELYNYGYLRLANSNAATTYRLMHNKDYSIIWNRKTNNWTVVEVK